MCENFLAEYSRIIINGVQIHIKHYTSKKAVSEKIIFRLPQNRYVILSVSEESYLLDTSKVF